MARRVSVVILAVLVAVGVWAAWVFDEAHRHMVQAQTELSYARGQVLADDPALAQEGVALAKALIARKEDLASAPGALLSALGAKRFRSSQYRIGRLCVDADCRRLRDMDQSTGHGGTTMGHADVGGCLFGGNDDCRSQSQTVL